MKKTKGESPDFENKTKKITNVELRNARIAALQKEFDQLSYDGCFKTFPITVGYTPDQNKNTLQVGSPFMLVGIGKGYDPFKSYLGLHFENAQQINTFPLDDLANHSKFFKKMSKSSKTVEGNAIIYFTNLTKNSPSFYLPTIEPTQRGEQAELYGFASKIELYNTKNQLLYEKNFDIPAKQSVKELVFNDTLGKNGKPGDFDVRGLKVSMTPDEVNEYAQQHNWNKIERPGRLFNWITFCPAGISCDALMINEPSGTFRLDVFHKDGIIYKFRYETNIEASQDYVEKLILKKYGKPLTDIQGHPGEYFYGISTKEFKHNSHYPRYSHWALDHPLYIYVTEYKKNGILSGKYKLLIDLVNTPENKIKKMQDIKPEL